MQIFPGQLPMRFETLISLPKPVHMQNRSMFRQRAANNGSCYKFFGATPRRGPFESKTTNCDLMKMSPQIAKGMPVFRWMPPKHAIDLLVSANFQEHCCHLLLLPEVSGA